MKKRKLILIMIILFTSSVMAVSVLKFKSKLINNATVTSSTQEILGIWYLENDSSIKKEFLQNGHLKTYVDNVLVSDDLFELTNTCNGHTSTDESAYLKITDGEDNFVDCNVFNGISANNNSLSLTDNRGKIVIFTR